MLLSSVGPFFVISAVFSVPHISEYPTTNNEKEQWKSKTLKNISIVNICFDTATAIAK